VQPENTSYWILRIGAALCFIGHGAFGFITKAAWLPYFAVVGIPEWFAWRLMPIVGAVDVLVGMAVLFAPRGIPLIYMVVWAAWTALLRPLAGESVFETLERAGNYGVPLALALMTGVTLTRAGLFEQVQMSRFARHDSSSHPQQASSHPEQASSHPQQASSHPQQASSHPQQASSHPERSEGSALVRPVLQWTTVLLLLGHGGLGVLGKAGLTAHYTAVALPSTTTVIVGWFEIGLAAAVALRPAAGLLVFVAVWKLATESLWFPAGAPIWEFVERAGSYAAPLALAALRAEPRASSLPSTVRA
jgi:hypothetical protein